MRNRGIKSRFLIVCTELDAARNFLETVVDLTNGERPLFHPGVIGGTTTGTRSYTWSARPKPLTPDDVLGHVAFNFEDLRLQTEVSGSRGPFVHACAREA
jgi:hypothetical protein